MARLPPRITKVLVEHRRPPNQKLRPLHRQFISALGCCVCGRPAPSECAHVRITEAEYPGSGGGMGLKPSDKYVVPLCATHHREQHAIGELTFWAELGVEPLNLALQLWSRTGDLEAGVRLILRCQQSIALHRAPVTRVTPTGGTP